MPGFFPGVAPAQPAGDHQVNDQEEVVVEHEHDALADAAHAADDLAVSGVERRIDGAQDERAEEPDPLEAPADDVRGQRFDVDDDVGQFRQSLPQPLDNLLARPVMVVVQVQDDRVERQPLVAADGTPPPTFSRQSNRRSSRGRIEPLHVAACTRLRRRRRARTIRPCSRSTRQTPATGAASRLRQSRRQARSDLTAGLDASSPPVTCPHSTLVTSRAHLFKNERRAAGASRAPGVGCRRRRPQPRP